MQIKKLGKVIFIISIILISLLIFYSIFAFYNFELSKRGFNKTRVEINKEQINKEKNNTPMQTQKQNNVSEQKKGSYQKVYHIFISLDELKMYVFKNEKLSKTYPVSGGKPSTPSPAGTWIITNKDTWGEGFGGHWMGFYVPWGMYGIHGTITPWEIGKYNASEGCIRMNNKDLKELYRMIPHGTKVTIEHKNRPFRPMKNGDIGSDVFEVQRSLKKLGYFHGYAGGVFETSFEASVKKFQRENKLYASGIIYKNTYEMISKKAAEIKKGENTN